MDNVLLAYVSAAPLLALIGVAWAPFAVAIGLVVGRKREAIDLDPPSAGRFVTVTAMHSIIMVFPWVYLFAHWIGKPVPHRFIKFGYAALYVRWFFAPILIGVYGGFRLMIDDLTRFMGEETISISIAFFIIMVILSGLNSCIAFLSLRGLLKKKSIIGAQQTLPFHSKDFYYLKPMFVWLIVEVGMLIVGMFTFFAFWAYSLSTVWE